MSGTVEVPRAVRAIADKWGGEGATIVQLDIGNSWGFEGDGFHYLVTRPGAPYACYEDSGMPIGDFTSKDWTVRAINDAPDSFWHVTTDGKYRRSWDLVEEQLWEPDEDEKRLLEARFALTRAVPFADDGWTVADTDEAKQIIRMRDEVFELGARLYGWTD